MRKTLLSLASALMMLPSALFAQTMTEENPTLDQLGYRIERDVNFREGLYRIGDDGDFSEITPNNALQFGASEDYKINNYAPSKVTNEGLEFMSIQLPGDGIELINGTGLRSSKNERWIVVNNLREGQIVAIEFPESETDTARFVVNSVACNGNTGWADTFVDPLIVEPISGAIHELQELGGGEIDTYRYFKVINAGSMYAKFNGKDGANVIYRMQIWSDKNDAEAVSEPSLKMVRVNGTSRDIAFKPGVSTFGSVVTTYYTLDGSDPVYLKDSEEIDHWEYVYEEDEEGNQVATDSTAIYKKVLDIEKVQETGYFGDGEYFDPELEYITVDKNNDEDDGVVDGLVTIKAVSISEATNVISAITTEVVSVGEIILNAPTFTLVNFSGTDRTYKVNWDNNTQCGEDYSFVIENGEGAYLELEGAEAFAEYEGITSSISIKATVKVAGYTDGIAEQDVDAKDIVMEKKEIGNGLSEEHGWDFRNLPQEVIEKINGTVDHYALLDEEGNETETFTVEQFEEGETPDGVEPIYKRWGWDALDTRVTGRHWRTWIQDYEYVDNEEGGIDTLLVGTHYADDETGLFVGLDVDNSHPNYSTLAIFTNETGLYFMTKGTIVISDVQYGEFVKVITSNGTSVAQSLDAVGGCTIDVGAGVYVYSIDVFTYDNLPDAIESVNASSTSAKAAAFYSINGVRLAAPQKGINIVKYSDGSVKKILVK